MWVTIFVILEDEKLQFWVYVRSRKSILSIFKAPEWSNLGTMTRDMGYIINNYLNSDQLAYLDQPTRSNGYFRSWSCDFGLF